MRPINEIQESFDRIKYQFIRMNKYAYVVFGKDFDNIKELIDWYEEYWENKAEEQEISDENN